MDATFELFFNASRGAMGRNVGSGESVRRDYITQEINDLLAPRNSSQSTESLLVRSQVTVKSEKLLPSPVKTNLSQKANSFAHESSSSDESLKRVSVWSGELGHDQFKHFLRQQVKGW